MYTRTSSAQLKVSVQLVHSVSKAAIGLLLEDSLGHRQVCKQSVPDSVEAV